MNIHLVEDKDKQVVEVLYFCSDFHCQEFLLQEDNQKKYGKYQGWHSGHSERSTDARNSSEVRAKVCSQVWH